MTAVPERAPDFESTRLAARRLGRGDEPLLQAVFEAAGDYFLRINGRASPDADSASREIETCVATEGRDVALLFLRSDNAPIGAIGWWQGNPEPDVALLGMLLLVPERRGQGLAREAAAALEGWLAGNGIKRLRTAVASTAYREHKLLRALGFTDMSIREHTALGLAGANIALFEKPLG